MLVKMFNSAYNDHLLVSWIKGRHGQSCVLRKIWRIGVRDEFQKNCSSRNETPVKVCPHKLTN